MTTIVYHHGTSTITADSRLVRSGTVISDSFAKWREIGDSIWFFCGSVSDVELLISWFADDEETPSLVPDCSAFCVIGGTVYRNSVSEDGLPEQVKMTFSDAIGSGEQFAISAMYLGMDAEQAMKHAICLDPFTGGDVVVFDVSTMSFKQCLTSN